MPTHNENNPDSNVHGANMGHISGRQDPGGPHVGPMNFAIWVTIFRKGRKIWYNYTYILFFFKYRSIDNIYVRSLNIEINIMYV